MKNPIEALFKPMSRLVFLDHYRANTPVVTHGQTKLIAELAALPILQSLESLLSIWPSYVNAYQPGISDEANSIRVDPNQAQRLFQEGRGLYFDDPDKVSPLLHDWLDAIKKDLGLSTLTYSRSLIYAIAKGRGTSPHFDQNINFVLQISGTKQWTIAPNTHVENPLSRHTIGLDMDSELASYTAHAMPDTFPKNGTEYILEPGSVLFLPRGSWHATEAITDTLSLNFTYSAPSWIDIFTYALRSRLLPSREWRATADFVTDAQLQAQSKETFDLMLSEICFEMQNWSAEDVLRATELDSPSS